ncbi:TPA: T3SS effector NleG family protein [Escherichia coli]|uniref:T3SS effector NleG family protein n=1 Tax=Escherichia coli TaxID=562 RepID=UPI00117B1DAC|nr:T3SS effector NleG family protein [Escherichia coli]
MLIVGVHNMMLHHISDMDSFSVEPVFDHHFNRSRTRRHRHLAERLERQLNNGNTFLQNFHLYMEQARSVPSRVDSVRKSMLEKIDNNAFTVNPGDFSCDEEYLNCPVTLCIPEKGVFVRNALRSDICSLYDRDALTEIIQRNSPHPLSREIFSPEMIIGKEECHFNTTEQHFCVAYSQDSYL